MAILNNIAFGHEMKPIFQYGFYAGTLGNTIFGRLGGFWLAFKAPQRGKPTVKPFALFNKPQ